MTQITRPRPTGSLLEDLPHIFAPKTTLAKLLMWFNLPFATILVWITMMNGVIPWPDLIQPWIPINWLWPWMWFLVSGFVFPFVAAWWEDRYGYGESQGGQTRERGRVEVGKQSLRTEDIGTEKRICEACGGQGVIFGPRREV